MKSSNNDVPNKNTKMNSKYVKPSALASVRILNWHLNLIVFIIFFSICFLHLSVAAGFQQ